MEKISSAKNELVEHIEKLEIEGSLSTKGDHDQYDLLKKTDDPVKQYLMDEEAVEPTKKI